MIVNIDSIDGPVGALTKRRQVRMIVFVERIFYTPPTLPQTENKMTRLLYLYNSNPMWITPRRGAYPEAAELARMINSGEWTFPDEVWKLIPPPDPLCFNATVHGKTVIVTPGAPPRMALLGITPRQREVMLLLAQGLTEKQAAMRLNRSERWLRMQVHAVKRTLGVSTCAGAVSRIAQGR